MLLMHTRTGAVCKRILKGKIMWEKFFIVKYNILFHAEQYEGFTLAKICNQVPALLQMNDIADTEWIIEYGQLGSRTAKIKSLQLYHGVITNTKYSKGRQ